MASEGQTFMSKKEQFYAISGAYGIWLPRQRIAS